MSGSNGEGGSTTLKRQLVFSAKTDCPRFNANPFVKGDSICKDCQKHLRDHRAEAVTEADIATFAKQELGHLGTYLISHPTSGAKLFVGGIGACSAKFVKSEKVSRFVNCAPAMAAFNPAWHAQVQNMESSGEIVIRRLNWEDVPEQKLWKDTKWDQLLEAIEFVESSLRDGRNVVVHCMQGKSRSVTVILAYLTALRHCASIHAALEFTKDKRPMAEPNEGFLAQLREFEKSQELSALRVKLGIA